MSNADINGRAAAIECYLDLTFAGGEQPHVIWTNYKKDADVYQGALNNKDVHTRAFLKKAAPKIAEGNYDVTKLQAVLDVLIAQCSSMAEQAGDGESF